MASEAVSSTEPAYDPGPWKADWRDELWRALVGSLDASLRSYYDIREFTEDPCCVLRIGLMLAQMPVTLSDGMQIAEGELVGALHLWNEHMPRYSGRGPNLAWAKEMRRRVLRSFAALASYVERESTWQPVRAFRGDSMLSSRIGSAQMRRLALRHGFEIVEPAPSLSRDLHTLADSAIVWGLTRAFNPAALPRQRFLRDHHQLWISRPTLHQVYGRDARDAAAAAPEQVA